MNPSDIDKEWLAANLEMVGQIARDGFEVAGHGAVVVDLQGEGNPEPTIYLPSVSMPGHDEYTAGLVRDYSPDAEFVVVLIRPGEMESSYRVALPGACA
jgi:hypothetical protein